MAIGLAVLYLVSAGALFAPTRLYIVGRDVKIEYKSQPGPFGFEAAGLAEALAHLPS